MKVLSLSSPKFFAETLRPNVFGHSLTKSRHRTYVVAAGVLVQSEAICVDPPPGGVRLTSGAGHVDGSEHEAASGLLRPVGLQSEEDV